MNRILDFIVRFCSFLWIDARFRIIDSEATTSFGGNAFIVVASARLRLRFVADRDQLFLELQEVDAVRPKEWYSIDLIRRLVTGNRESSAVLDESYAMFLKENMLEIESLFDGERMPDTRKRLQDLKRKRAKEMFG
jgi:hypothetical protein